MSLNAQQLRSAQEELVPTKPQSLAFMRNLLRTAISSVVYLRNIFPEYCFKDHLVSGMAMKALLPKTEEAKFLISWLEQGVFDSLDKQYLRTLVFGIYDKEDDANSMRESYHFNISYENQGISLDLEARNGSRMKGPTYTKDNIRNATTILMRKLISMMETLDNGPTTKYMALKLLYYEERTPADYEPPFFQPCPSASDYHFPCEPLEFKLGQVTTPYHSLSLDIQALPSELEKDRNKSMFVKPNSLETGPHSKNRDSREREDAVVNKLIEDCHNCKNCDLKCDLSFPCKNCQDKGFSCIPRQPKQWSADHPITLANSTANKLYSSNHIANKNSQEVQSKHGEKMTEKKLHRTSVDREEIKCLKCGTIREREESVNWNHCNFCHKFGVCWRCSKLRRKSFVDCAKMPPSQHQQLISKHLQKCKPKNPEAHADNQERECNEKDYDCDCEEMEDENEVCCLNCGSGKMFEDTTNWNHCDYCKKIGICWTCSKMRRKTFSELAASSPSSQQKLVTRHLEKCRLKNQGPSNSQLVSPVIHYGSSRRIIAPSPNTVCVLNERSPLTLVAPNIVLRSPSNSKKPKGRPPKKLIPPVELAAAPSGSKKPKGRPPKKLIPPVELSAAPSGSKKPKGRPPKKLIQSETVSTNRPKILKDVLHPKQYEESNVATSIHNNKKQNLAEQPASGRITRSTLHAVEANLGITREEGGYEEFWNPGKKIPGNNKRKRYQEKTKSKENKVKVTITPPEKRVAKFGVTHNNQEQHQSKKKRKVGPTSEQSMQPAPPKDFATKFPTIKTNKPRTKKGTSHEPSHPAQMKQNSVVAQSDIHKAQSLPPNLLIPKVVKPRSSPEIGVKPANNQDEACDMNQHPESPIADTVVVPEADPATATSLAVPKVNYSPFAISRDHSNASVPQKLQPSNSSFYITHARSLFPVVDPSFFPSSYSASNFFSASSAIPNERPPMAAIRATTPKCSVVMMTKANAPLFQ